MTISVRFAGRIHYVGRWRAAFAAITGRPPRALCGARVPRRYLTGDPCGPCALRAGEPRL